MPYIREEKKADLKELIAAMNGKILEVDFFVGDLNYLITMACQCFLHKDPDNFFGYSDLNSIIGVLECAKQEFYRRKVVEYENGKIVKNGDVYL